MSAPATPWRVIVAEVLGGQFACVRYGVDASVRLSSDVYFPSSVDFGVTVVVVVSMFANRSSLVDHPPRTDRPTHHIVGRG